MGGPKGDDSPLPVINLAPFLDVQNLAMIPAEARSECMQIADCLHNTGALIVRDPRVSMADNDRFVDMMESYFAREKEFKKRHERPELHYQVGVTPEGVEVPVCATDPACLEEIEKQDAANRPHIPQGPDPKWRYMWRVGPRPESTEFEELNADPVIPEGFDNWEEVMNTWGNKMLQTCETVAEMAEIGFGLEHGDFSNKLKNAPHVLAPTGSDLEKYGKKGTIFAGYHYDLNFLTIHGKSRYPGLFLWLRDGTRQPVKIPDGCLLLQAGKQLEWYTGGYVRAGMHEVVVSDETVAKIEKAKEDNASLWRISSTVFCHAASDAVLQPLGKFSEECESAKDYPPIKAGKQVVNELQKISLKAN